MAIKNIKSLASSVNIAAELSEEELQKIGNRVLTGFQEDLNSMSEWLADVERIEALACMQSRKKSTPLPNSANVKLPLITKACYEYASTAYPEIIKDDKVVQGYVLGMDIDGSKSDAATKCTDYMNYQLLMEDEEWEGQLDTLLTLLPLYGFICKKTYYDPVRDINRSVICNYKELIINADAKSLEEAPRISEILHLKLNNFVECKNKKVNGVSVYLSKPVDQLMVENENDELDVSIDIIEQHCKLDLDEDGYSEPYIVTVIKSTGQVLRIVPRFDEEDVIEEDGHICYINAIKCFVAFHFLKSPKGKLQSVGFGWFLLHMTEAANSALNQLLDAGQLANMQGGYRDARAKVQGSGNSRHDPGQWQDIKVLPGAVLKDCFFPIDYKEPSNVFFQLLGLLVDMARDLTSSEQINNGTQSSENAKTGATLALQREGKKTGNAINKRVYKSLTQEFNQLFLLNSKYLDKRLKKETYSNSIQAGKILEVSQADFDRTKITMFPVADPTLNSQQERMMEAQAVLTLVKEGLDIDRTKATMYILNRMQLPDIESLMPDPQKQPPPNPDVIKIQGELEDKSQKNKLAAAKQASDAEIAAKDQIIEAMKAEAEIELKKAQAINQLAQAGAAEQVNTLEDEAQQLKGMETKIKAELQLTKQQHEKEMQATQQEHEQILADKQAQAAKEQAAQGGSSDTAE